MVSNVYETGDNKIKSRDDSPMRVSVLFEYDPQKASLLERIKYDLAREKMGEFPPRRALCYIWANKESDAGKLFDSTLSKRAKVIVLEAGHAKAGKWVDEEVNILEDYQEGFRRTAFSQCGHLNNQ